MYRRGSTRSTDGGVGKKGELEKKVRKPCKKYNFGKYFFVGGVFGDFPHVDRVDRVDWSLLDYLKYGNKSVKRIRSLPKVRDSITYIDKK